MMMLMNSTMVASSMMTTSMVMMMIMLKHILQTRLRGDSGDYGENNCKSDNNL